MILAIYCSWLCGALHLEAELSMSETESFSLEISKVTLPQITFRLKCKYRNKILETKKD